MDANVKEIAKVLSLADNKIKIYSFLESLLTPRELEEVGKRWEVVKLLDIGMTQRAISSQLGMSTCKITRGSKELKKENSVFKYFIELNKGETNV